MKKLLYLGILGATLTACCGGQTTRAVAVDSTSVDSIEVVDSSLIDTISIDSVD